MVQHQGENSQNDRQSETHQSKDVIRGAGAVGVVVKGSEQDQVLVGDHQQDAEQKPHRKRSGKSFEDESSQPSQYQMDDSDPYGGNQ